jgi:hypothetical protein
MLIKNYQLNVIQVQSLYPNYAMTRYRRHGNETQHDLGILRRECLSSRIFRTLDKSGKRVKYGAQYDIVMFDR